jgi:8-oxo-dGTP pyrophosphatase MutT (NUDIX family)
MADEAFVAGPETTIHEGHSIRLVEAHFTSPSGATFTRELVRHPGAVSVVALHDDDTVVLERQFRSALGRNLLEIPAGKLDVPGEDPQAAAARELAEEVGLAATTWTRLAVFHNSPGFTDERSITYLAQGLSEVPTDKQGHEEEAMTIERVPLADVPGLIASGDLEDAKSIIGLLLTLRLLGR